MTTKVPCGIIVISTWNLTLATSLSPIKLKLTINNVSPFLPSKSHTRGIKYIIYIFGLEMYIGTAILMKFLTL